MDKEKNCLNCENFQQYYIKHNSGFKTVSGHGHCKNPRMWQKDVHKRLCEKADCKHWQPAESHKQERDENVKTTLIRICRQLEKIAELLQDEN